MYQYSGPGSQEVADEWWDMNDFWHAMLTQKGYIVLCVDGRGTGYRGEEFKKCTYEQLGKFEVDDQAEVATIVGAYPYVDKSRIGIWGWSFGGFMSSNCIFQKGDVFKMAIAVAPVTNWRFTIQSIPSALCVPRKKTQQAMTSILLLRTPIS